MRKLLVALLACLMCSCTIPYEDGDIAVYMCDTADCEQLYINFVEKQPSLCAFYEMGLPKLAKFSHLAGAQSKIFDKYHWGYGEPVSSKNYMHHKFCVSEDAVITGSMNPTIRGRDENDNNVVVITSPLLAANYREEWHELGTDIVRPTKITSVNISGILVENYFCPDDCEKELPRRLLSLFDAAQHSIHFMTFSFTRDDFGDALIHAHNRGVDVSGVFEKRQESEYSEYSRLKEHGIDVFFDSNPATMHHKVFIIDESIVVTGSMNPSNNGLLRNDENILIIHSKSIAQKYEYEFKKLIS